MADADLVTVFRSADPSAEEDARQAHDLLVAEGLPARLLDDKAPGVMEGCYEVRVPVADAARAEAILAENPPEEELRQVDSSHALDLETVFGASSEMEAFSIQGVLESNGIEAVIVGDSVLPNFPFEVRVAKEHMQQAVRIIEDAQRAGPAAAEEAAEADTSAQ